MKCMCERALFLMAHPPPGDGVRPVHTFLSAIRNCMHSCYRASNERWTAILALEKSKSSPVSP